VKFCASSTSPNDRDFSILFSKSKIKESHVDATFMILDATFMNIYAQLLPVRSAAETYIALCMHGAYRHAPDSAEAEYLIHGV